MARPTLTTAFTRAVRLKCPRCGNGRLFEKRLKMATHCSECQLKYERDPGYFLGSTYLNYGLTALVTTVTYVVVHFVYRVPNKTLTPPLMVFIVLFPVFFFRHARSFWLAADCYLDSTGVHTDDPVG